MKVAAILGVKNDCDLIQPCLERSVYLADRGVLEAEFEGQQMGESGINQIVDLGVIDWADAVQEKSVRIIADQ